MPAHSPELVGRKGEITVLERHLDGAFDGTGSMLFILGEPGIGKSRLVEEFVGIAEGRNARVLTGSSALDSPHPFLVFSRLLEEVTEEKIFEMEEFTSFVKIFTVDMAGLLLAQAESKETDEMDADIFAAMLSAVQDFVRDSFESAGKNGSGLGRLEYGDMKILIEHGEKIFLTGVVKGREHAEMKNRLKLAVSEIEDRHAALLENWSGRTDELKPVQDIIDSLAGEHFLVRKDLEGVNLENERLRIADLVLEKLLAISKSSPLLVVLDELHWADESSLFVLNYIVRNIKTDKILIIGMARPERDTGLRQRIDAMKDEELASELVLEKLDAGAVREIVDNAFPKNDFPGEFLERIAEQCVGNPFFVNELVSQMLADGSIALSGDAYTLVDESYTMPKSIDDMVHRKLGLLDLGAITMAEYASCIGQDFAVSDALSLDTVDDPEAALDELRNAEVVRLSNGNARFTHGLFQEAIYRSISPRWLPIYHMRLGEYYERAYSGHLTDVAYELARHYHMSKTHDKSLTYCIMAGQKAENAFAAEQGIEFYRNALDALAGMPETPQGPDQKMEVNTRLGALHKLIGELPQALGDYRTALDLSQRKEVKAGLFCKIAEVYENMGRFEDCREASDEGLSALGEEVCVERVMLLKAKGNAFVRTGDIAAAIKILQEGEKNAMQLGSDEVLGDIYHSLGTFNWHMGDYAKGLELLEKAAGTSERLGDVSKMARSIGNMGMIYSEIGDLDKAMESYRASMDIFQKLGDKRAIGIILNSIGLVNYEHGALDKAIEYNRQSLDIKKKIGDRYGTRIAITNQGMMFHDKGDLENALKHLDEGLELARKINDKNGAATSLSNMAQVWRDMGDLDRARRLSEEGVAISKEVGAVRTLSHNQYNLAETMMLQSDLEKAKDIVEETLAQSTKANSRLEMGMGHMLMGQILREEGGYGAAVKAFEEARELFLGMKAKNALAKLSHELALTHAISGDTVQAKAEMKNALDQFGESGMSLWADKCREALARFDDHCDTDEGYDETRKGR